MDNQYGIKVTNKFQLFLEDEEDPLEILRLQEEANEKLKETKKKDGKTDKKGSKGKQNKKAGGAPEKAKTEVGSAKPRDGTYAFENTRLFCKYYL